MSLELTPEAKNAGKISWVVSHRACPDGFMGLFVLYNSGILDRDTQFYVDVPSTKKVPNIEGDVAIIVDVAYRPDILLGILKNFRKVYFLDHHVTHIEEIRKIDDPKLHLVYKLDKSGASIAWEWLYGPKAKRPSAVLFVDDSDRGIWKMKNTKPYTTAFDVEFEMIPDRKHLAKMKVLLEPAYLRDMIERGKLYHKYKERIINAYIPYANERQWNGYRVMLINVSGPLTGELATRLARDKEGIDFVIAYHFSVQRESWIYSLRSKAVNVEQIAKKRGGGGHHGASAFSSKISPVELLKTDP